MIPTQWFHWFKQGRSRQVRIVFIILSLFGLSYLLEFGLLYYYESQWDAQVEAKSRKALHYIEEEFQTEQRAIRRIAVDLAQHQSVLTALGDHNADPTGLFAQAAKVSKESEVGVEIYDRNAHLKAWHGRSGQSHEREVLDVLKGRWSSHVTRGPIYSHLFVITPVRVEKEVIGAALIRRTIEVNYTLNNKFIDRVGLEEKFGRKLDLAVEINFSEDADLRKDGRFASAPLLGIDGRKVGVVSVLRPARSAFLESVSNTFQKVNAFLLVLLIVILSYAAFLWANRIHSLLARCAAITGLIWLVRYILVWIEIPSIYISTGVFDPGYFASTFGGGLVRSIGEMTLTSIALLLNVSAIAGIMLKGESGGSIWWHPRNVGFRFGLALIATGLIFLLLRGYAAVIRSAVFDSTLQYNDPKVIVPSFELGLMVLNLFVISFCLILVTAGMTSFVVSLAATQNGKPGRYLSWISVGLLFVTAAYLFGILQPNPLMSFAYRLLFAFGMLGFTLYLHYCWRRRGQLITLPNGLVALALSAAFFYPLLDSTAHEKDRARVQVFAAEVLRPVDSWLTNVVDEALRGFRSDETVDVLFGANPEEIEKLAFRHWAQSSASREGYNCLFAILDSTGEEISRFVIGGQALMAAVGGEVLRGLEKKRIRVEQVGSGINAVKLYSGVTPIATMTGARWYGRVVIAAGQQSLFRGETPSILRSVSHESLESFYRPITISEFRQGELFTTNSNVLPLGYKPPGEVLDAFRDPLVTSLWVEEQIGAKDYETLFVRRTATADQLIALSVEKLDLTWHLFGIVRVIVYYAIVVMCVLIAFFTVQILRGRTYEFTFRAKLLIALLVTAIVPVIIIASYGRVFATERLMESLSGRLEQETATVAVAIQQRLRTSGVESSASISHAVAEQVTNETGTDFNVYLGNMLQASSRPELYEAGILDRRLSGTAYAGVVKTGERFYLETENIGSYQYAVGYRPLIAETGGVLGVVAVPTIYRQDELEAEISKNNAFLFGVYAIVLLSIVVIATTLANRIASPIHRLTEATKRVSRGDLDVRVQVPHVDGEIGELISSFESMTRDLKQNREYLIRYERELAWKEMAKQVAHEIKNPLTPMKLSMQHLRQTFRDNVSNFDQIFEEVSKTVIDQIDALSRIASEFSRFARMPGANLEVCDVNRIVEESISLFEKDSSISFELNLQRDLPFIRADREELRRAFINIIRNGLQSMDNAGRIVVTTRKTGGLIEVSIRDFGTGIPHEIREKLFQPNFSTKTDGMGLGLAIVKKTIEDLKGSIAIESEEGKGTTVVVLLPVTNGEA